MMIVVDEELLVERDVSAVRENFCKIKSGCGCGVRITRINSPVMGW